MIFPGLKPDRAQQPSGLCCGAASWLAPWWDEGSGRVQLTLLALSCGGCLRASTCPAVGAIRSSAQSYQDDGASP